MESFTLHNLEKIKDTESGHFYANKLKILKKNQKVDIFDTNELKNKKGPESGYF